MLKKRFSIAICLVTVIGTLAVLSGCSIGEKLDAERSSGRPELNLSNQGTTPSADIDQWSEAEYTDQWSEAEYTDQWSEAEYTDQWSEAEYTDQWSEAEYTDQWSQAEYTDQWSNNPNTDQQPKAGQTGLLGQIGGGSSSSKSGEKAAITDFEELYGTWAMWAPGNATSLYDEETGEYVTHEFNPGASSGRVTINEDGTYSMIHNAWAKGKTVEGKWRLSYPSEINGEKVLAIVLEDGVTNVDWAVVPAANGKITLLYAMEVSKDYILWVFDSELYR